MDKSGAAFGWCLDEIGMKFHRYFIIAILAVKSGIEQHFFRKIFLRFAEIMVDLELPGLISQWVWPFFDVLKKSVDKG